MDANKTPELIAKIKTSELEVREYIAQLETENARVIKAATKLQVSYLTQMNRTKELEKQVAKLARPSPVTDDRLKQIIHEHVMSDGGWDAFCQKNRSAIDAPVPNEDE